MYCACFSTSWRHPDRINVKISCGFQGLCSISIFIAVTLLFSAATYPAIFVLSENDKILLVEALRQNFRFFLNFWFKRGWIVFYIVYIELWRMFKRWRLSSNISFITLLHSNYSFANIISCLFPLVKSLVETVNVLHLLSLKRFWFYNCFIHKDATVLVYYSFVKLKQFFC